MAEWQNRPLDLVYPVIFLDAVHVKIRDGKVANRPIYLALAVILEDLEFNVTTRVSSDEEVERPSKYVDLPGDGQRYLRIGRSACSGVLSASQHHQHEITLNIACIGTGRSRTTFQAPGQLSLRLLPHDLAVGRAQAPKRMLCLGPGGVTERPDRFHRECPSLIELEVVRHPGRRMVQRLNGGRASETVQQGHNVLV